MTKRQRTPSKNRSPNLSEIFHHSSKRLIEEYEITRIALEHRGLKGTVREEALGQFLATHLPTQFQCATGEIISTTARSKQIDLIIAHSTRAPTLYRSGNIQVIPVEAVLAAVEVKTTLDEGELSRALANIQSVKMLKKTAFYKDEDPLHLLNKEMPNSRPVSGFIFAYDSIFLARVLKALIKAQAKVPRKRWIDGIFVLKKGYIVPKASGPEYVLRTESESALLRFYLRLWEHLILSWTPPIQLDAYFPNLSGTTKGGKH